MPKPRVASPFQSESKRNILDAERHRPGCVRPGGVPRDAERPDAGGKQVGSPVTQEQTSFVQVGDQSNR